MPSELHDVSRELCQKVDWDRPELAAVAETFRAGDSDAAALALVRHLRCRTQPVFPYTPEFVAALRAKATQEQKAEAAKRIGAVIEEVPADSSRVRLLHLPAETLHIGADAKLCEQMARAALAARPDWPNGRWGTVCWLCQTLAALWPLDEFDDAHAVPLLAWLLEQIEPEWDWARTWAEDMLGNSGHNWWLHTFLGFWMAGTYFPELKHLAKFQALSGDYLRRELRVLMEPDGFTRERAGYHWGTVQLFTRFVRLSELNGAVFPAEFKEHLREVAAAAWKLVTPDGSVPQMGDAGARHTPGTLLGALRCDAARYGIGEAKFVAETLDPDWQPPYAEFLPNLGEDLLPAYKKLRAVEPPADVCLPVSGYYVMRQNWTCSADWTCIDAGARGSLVSSHDHTAVFGFELYSRGRPVLVDNCSGPYGDSPERTWRESSAAHNVATVDGQDHIPIRNEWRWDGLVQPAVDAWLVEPTHVYFSGAHEGYARAPHRVPGCRRKMFYLRAGYWILIDRFTPEGDAEHEYQIHFHLMPPARLGEHGRAATSGEGGNVLIVPVPGASGEPSLAPSPYPIDGYDNPDHLTYTHRAAGRDIFVTLLVPFEDENVPEVSVELAEVESDERILAPWEATALSIRINGREHFYFDQHMAWNLPWRCGEYSGSGRLFHSQCGG